MADRSVIVERIHRTEDGCWIWQGATSSNGYGNVSVDGRWVSTHRLAHEYHHGPIPEGRRVLHSCDVKLCVNPTHLSLGSSAENSRQMVNRDRYRGPSKLTATDREKIAELCGQGLTQSLVAEMFGVSQGTISHVVTGKTSPVPFDPTLRNA